jgi:hypothetical protein
MFRHLRTFTTHSINMWGMMIGIVGTMTSCMKFQGIYTKSKMKHNKKGTLRSIIPLEEKTSILVVDSEEEDGQEAWV